MRLYRAGILMAAAILWGGVSAFGEVPGGPPLPNVDGQVYAAHGRARVGYFAVTDSYRFQGQYSLTYNFASIKPALLYTFADVDVEAISDVTSNFKPDRLAGTFEVGAQHVGTSPLGMFLRHQSPHNIDRNDRRQGSWDMAGARWQQPLAGGLLQVSAGRYIHTVAFDYQWDVDARADLPIGRTLGRLWTLRLDLHGVNESGGRGGFADYWIEPSVAIAAHVTLFAGVGQVHDIDVFQGKTDHPVMVGFAIRW